MSPHSAEIKYKTLFEQSPYGIVLSDRQGRILDFNETAHRDLEYTREEFANLLIADIDPVETASEIQAGINQILREGGAEFEVKHRTKKGEIRDVHIITRPLTLSGQTVFHSIWRDITEHKRADEMLRQTNTRLETLINAIPDIVIFKDVEGRYLMANTTAEASTGCKQEELVGKTNNELMPRETAEMCNRSDLEAIRRGEPIHAEEQFLDKSGRAIFLDTLKAPVYDTKGTLSGLLCIARDVTERKIAEEALHRSEEKFRTLFESATDGLFIIDTEGNLIDINRTAHERLGYTKEEMLSIHISQLAHPDFRDNIQERMEHLQKYGLCVCESAHLKKDGTVMPVEINARIIDFEGKSVFFSVIRDITERKQAEEKIRQNEQFIRNILDTVDAGFIVIDRDFRITTVNKAYCELVSGVCDEIIGRQCYEISHRTSRPCYEEGEECAVRQVFATGEPHAVLHRHTDQNGDTLFVETKAFPIKDITGLVVSVIETVNNITGKHLLEEERLKTQKLESIGTLAGGIAHDFNNLLQGVFGYISMVKMYLDEKEKALAMLEQAEKALHMSVNLTSQLLTFSKGGMPAKKRIALRPLIEDSAKFALSGSRSNYSFTYDDVPRLVEADEGQISQAIHNIVLNADQAMPTGGTISVTLKNVDAPAKGLPVTLTAGEYVEISIADAGIGIPEQYLSRIFDPYFTTKDNGSGLGLATSYSIIKNHGGLIDVSSKPGSGTTFFVYIPAIEAEELKRETIPAMAAMAPTGKILVMDDEVVVRDIMEIMITSLGHEVEFAENGEEAVVKYLEAQASGRPFEIVILDLTIRGGKGGKETVRELIALDPELTAVVSSGYSDDAVMSEYLSHGFRACLTKPYEIGTLKDTLNALLR